MVRTRAIDCTVKSDDQRRADFMAGRGNSHLMINTSEEERTINARTVEHCITKTAASYKGVELKHIYQAAFVFYVSGRRHRCVLGKNGLNDSTPLVEWMLSCLADAQENEE